jgi:2-methylcitrate dehydratase
MTEVERLAHFGVSARFGHLSEQAAQQLEIRLLDSHGCAIGALAA